MFNRVCLRPLSELSIPLIHAGYVNKKSKYTEIRYESIPVTQIRKYNAKINTYFIFCEL